MKRGKTGGSAMRQGRLWAAVSLSAAVVFLSTCSPNELLTDIQQRVTDAGLDGTVATPVFSYPPPGLRVAPGNVTVTITVSTPGAAIYYTLDGTTPSAASALYTPPLVISGQDGDSTTITAIALADRMHPSLLTNATYPFSSDSIPVTVDVSPANAGTVNTFPSYPCTAYLQKNQGFPVAAAAATGWGFVKWEATSGTAGFVDSSSPVTDVVAASACGIQAVFAQYQLTAGANDASYGTVSPAGPTMVGHGVATSLTATPATGYDFTNWTVASGVPVISDAASASTTVTLSSGAAAIQANFTPKKYGLTVSAGTGGVAGGSATVSHGIAAPLSASANSGYIFNGWTVTDGTGVSFGDPDIANTTVTLTGGPATVRADFIPVYTLTVTAATGGSIQAPLSPSVIVTQGAVTDIKASPSAGYRFLNWTSSAAGVAFGSSTSASTTVTLSAEDATIQANFILQYSLTLSASTGGTVTTPPTSPVLVDQGASTGIVAMPSSGYEFVDWTVTSGAPVIGDAASASTAVTLSSGDATIQATFRLKSYSLSVTAGTGGTVTAPASSPVTVNHGAATTITAVPTLAGWSFKNWTVVSGSASFASATSASTTVTLTAGAAAIRANFANPGSAWMQTTMPGSKNWSSVTHGLVDSVGTFVAVASGSSDWAATSTDGIAWTKQTLPSAQSWNSVAYGDGVFAAVVWNSTGSSNVAAWSNDGVTWHQVTMPTSRCWNSVSYGGGRFVAVPGSGQPWPLSELTRNSGGAVSSDGKTWTSINLGSSQNWYSVCYGNGRYVAVAYNSNVASYSDNGTDWTVCSLPSSRYWTSVTYGSGTFVAVAGGPGGATNVAATSTDGIHWTSRTMSASSNWQSVAYGNGYFAATSWNSTTVAATSPDGITWTSCAMPSAQVWESVTWAGGVFVAVAYNSGVAATSPPR
jgi:hypothetical protein